MDNNEAYILEFKQYRDHIEKIWDDLKNSKPKSSFDNLEWCTDDGRFHCFNAMKYSLEQAVKIMRPKIKKGTEECFGNFDHVGKSFVRHRCGTSEDGPCCGWWFGDDEYGFHAIPVWMFTSDDDYDSIEEALGKENR